MKGDKAIPTIGIGAGVSQQYYSTGREGSRIALRLKISIGRASAAVAR